MTSEPTTMARATRRVDASAARLFDARLDPVKTRASRFATSTGRMLRTEVAVRAGGRFCLVDSTSSPARAGV